jgi:nucleoside-diphosphate-sugar epimerase
MVVLVAGAGGRLGRLVVVSLLARGHRVRALVRTTTHAADLEQLGATPVIADLRGDVEWTAEGCDAAVFAAGAHRVAELGAIDAGGAAKLAEAADHYDLRRFIFCSAVGAGHPERRRGPLLDFLTAKRDAERRLERLELPWTILRFGALSDAPGRGRIATSVNGQPLRVSRQDAADTVAEALQRPSLVRRVVHVVDGDVHIGFALDAVEPTPLPRLRASGLGAAQADNPPPDPELLYPDAAPLDAAVDYVGEGPLPPEEAGNDDPSPGVP